MKILVIEDSLRLQKSLRAGLRRLGYAVDIASNGQEGLVYALSGDYDLVVLDLMLPKKSGLEVLHEIRKSSRNPEILILSARGQVRDRVTGLQRGADDYLVKPFSFDELHARIQALIRRRFRQKSPIISIGKLDIDTSKHIACHGDEYLPLTPTEMSILEYLALSRGRVISPDLLLEHVYDSDTYTSRNAIEAHVSSLRKKLRKRDIDDLIKTRRGFGYLID